MARHALPNVVEGKLVPVAIFLGSLQIAGATGALLAALTWTLGSIGWRVATGRTVPGLVVLSAIGLVARTVLALATGSLVVYFLQPTATTVLVGTAFLVSVPLGRPLAGRLASDFCPLDPATAEHPHVRRFFVRLSLLWAATSLINASVTIWLLLTQPVGLFVVIKSCLGPASAGLALVTAIVWFRSSARRAGLSFVITRSARGASVAPAAL